MIMPMEGTHYPTQEDETEVITASEPTHTVQDEIDYVTIILPAQMDEEIVFPEPIPGHFHYADALYWG